MVHELYDKPEKGITASAFDFICFFPGVVTLSITRTIFQFQG